MKMLISDYDITIVKNRNVDKDDLESINNLENIKDIIFVIATGRGKDTFYPSVKDLNIKYENAILYNGAIITNKKGEILFSKHLTYKNVESYLNYFLILFDQFNIGIAITTSERLLIVDSKEKLEEFLNTDNLDSIEILGISLGVVSKDLTETEKIYCLINENCKSLNVVMNNYYIDLLDPDVSKKNAIKFLMEMYNINEEDLYTIGDSWNDVSMFELTKNSYTFNFSPDKVKEKANYIVDSICDCINNIIL